MNDESPAAHRADAPIRTTNDLLELLDELLESGGEARWNRLFADRTSPCPFLIDWPDETLVGDFTRHALQPGHVLELGCGNGRNAIYMASQGSSVDAVDFSQAAIDWGKERAQAAGQRVRYIHF